MKKIIFALAALLCTFAAQAQAQAQKPVSNAERATPANGYGQQPAELKRQDQDERNAEKVAAPANHGQTVQAVAQSTPLTGSAKGAAVSAVASGGRSAQRARPTRTARGTRSHDSHQAGGSSAPHGHAGGNGHRTER
ncbi:hypothetical protein [Hymenobacter chitinivorans]|uniref:Uncharacterized protein n=1 Tax=Hymenobacter chitinivorans DSM 11115 TaxID=1121954 RepID=A0A2M9BN70_9BACT|nr:hypothetical protein [Hymenobacter chitinivorans]PJJ59399.1 hypothetical protein CLV45_0816 [Hymenobacter chitinivorans DSM 11115]